MLCGHATLATSFILFNRVDTDAKALHFDTAAGRLTATLVSRGQGGEVAISLPLGGPSAPSGRSGEFAALFAGAAGLGANDIEEVVTYDGERSCIVRLRPEVDLEGLTVDTRALCPTIQHYCIATQVAREREGGINSRVFVEAMGIPEDPVVRPERPEVAALTPDGIRARHARGILPPRPRRQWAQGSGPQVRDPRRAAGQPPGRGDARLPRRTAG